MNFNDQDRHCHPERSEGSGSPDAEIFRSAQDDQLAHLPMLVVKTHYRPTKRQSPQKMESWTKRRLEDTHIPVTPEEEFQRLLGGFDATFMAGGHTHTQQLRRIGDAS